MIELKGIYDINGARPAGSRGVERKQTNPAGRRAEAPGDQVKISPEAAARARLDQAVRPQAKVGLEEASAQRIQQLRERYAGDACPVGGEQIAEAMLRTIGGGEDAQ